MTNRVTIKTPADARTYLAARGLLDGLKLEGDTVVEDKFCHRCGGLGGGEQWRHTGYVCYECGGRNSRWTARTPLVEFAKSERRRECAANRRARKAAANAAAREERMLEGQRAWCEANGFGRVTFAERDAAREAAAEAKRAESQHVGTIGKRQVFTAKLVRVGSYQRECYSGFGMETVWFYNLRDEAGNLLVWKTTAGFYGPAACGEGEAPIGEGATVRFKATPKAHDAYRGEAQTIVQRVKVVEVVDYAIDDEAAA